MPRGRPSNSRDQMRHVGRDVLHAHGQRSAPIVALVTPRPCMPGEAWPPATAPPRRDRRSPFAWIARRSSPCRFQQTWPEIRQRLPPLFSDGISLGIGSADGCHCAAARRGVDRGDARVSRAGPGHTCVHAARAFQAPSQLRPLNTVEVHRGRATGRRHDGARPAVSRMS